LTQTPPPDAAPEHPAKVEKRRRTRLQLLGLIAGVTLGVLLLLIGVTVVGGRMYLVSGPGRELITGFVQGKQIGRYGRINVEGLSGDLFDDFTIRRVTVTDAKGVWLDARNVRVDWSYWALVSRRFHATEITAQKVQLIRRPQVEPPTTPPKPPPLAIDIDKFSGELELLEGFSKEYGRWKMEGEANVPRFGPKSGRIAADSLNRPGDFLRGTFSMGRGFDSLRLNLVANEKQGGPLAGSLGFSPDQPFTARAVIDDEGLRAFVRTGEFTPVTLRGRFDPSGSTLSGFFDFSGSDLLDPFVRKVGRTARFGFSAVPERGRAGVYGVAWELLSDNLNSRAGGLIRLSDRQILDDGFRIQLDTPNLTRLAGQEIAGPAAYEGVFTGDAQNWRLVGDVTLNGAELASYRATRLSGPLTVEAINGRYELEGEARVTGGAAEGVIGGLLGSEPRARFQATRLVDGGLLLRDLDLRGRALTLRGSGARNIAGGLSFRGRADITEVSRIRPGARGRFGGTLQAASARSGAPWSLSLDGRGRGLNIGLGELDRVLGAAPRLQFTGQLNKDRVLVRQARLTGAQGRADAEGVLNLGGRMRLAVDWSARGPFAVGPVELAGDMSGDGALTGTLARPQADLRARFDRAEVGPLDLTQANLVLRFRRGADGSDGRAAITAGSNYGPAEARGNFAFGGGRIRLSDVSLNAGGVTAQGAITLANRFPSSADLTFTARPGAFIVSGQADGRIRLTEGAGGETAILNVTASNLRPTGSAYTIRTLQLNGQGTLDRLPFTLVTNVGGPTPVQFDGSGVYSRQNRAQSVTLTGAGRVREVAFSTRAPAVIAIAGDGRAAKLDLAVGGGVLLADLRQDSRAALLQADLTSVELGSIAPDLRGRVTGTVSLRGQGSDLSGSANVTLAELRSVDAPRGLAVDARLDATLVDDQLRLRADGRSNGALQATADVVLPVDASAAPLRFAIARTRPMSGEVTAQGQIQPIWDLFVGGGRSLAGQVSARAALGGTLNEPRLNGRLDLTQGSFDDSWSGVRLREVALSSRFDDEVAVVERFTATDGGEGSATGQGQLGLRVGSASNLQLTLARFQVIDNDIAQARASGPVRATRAADGKIELSGRLDIDEARIEPNLPGSNGIVRMEVIEINKPGGDAEPEEERAETRARSPIALDIVLRSPNDNVRVVGRGLNVFLDVNARVQGTASDPILTGRAEVARGDWEFAGRRFVFDEDGFVTLSTDPRLIRLNLSATREDPAITATVNVTGTAARPEIQLTSSPALPEDEILSQVLFGRSASQLSAFEAAQLAASVGSLAGGGGFDVLGNLRELAGLDRLSFSGEASSLQVAGGRYITDDVYLEVIGGGDAGAAVQVEWQVRRNVAVTSRFGGEGDASLSVRWRRESGRPDGRRDGRPNRNRDQSALP